MHKICTQKKTAFFPDGKASALDGKSVYWRENRILASTSGRHRPSKIFRKRSSVLVQTYKKNSQSERRKTLLVDVCVLVTSKRKKTLVTRAGFETQSAGVTLLSLIP